MTTPIEPDQLRISIEMGDDYQPSDRLGDAFAELAAALQEVEAGSEVEGFLQFEIQVGNIKPRTTYDSKLGGWSQDGDRKADVIPKLK